jgi:hypothetical protein
VSSTPSLPTDERTLFAVHVPVVGIWTVREIEPAVVGEPAAARASGGPAAPEVPLGAAAPQSDLVVLERRSVRGAEVSNRCTRRKRRIASTCHAQPAVPWDRIVSCGAGARAGSYASTGTPARCARGLSTASWAVKAPQDGPAE